MDFATLPGPGDGEHVSLMRLTDGRVACCICFEFFEREQLAPAEDGKRWDVCQPCWDWEASYPNRSSDDR